MASLIRGDTKNGASHERPAPYVSKLLLIKRDDPKPYYPLDIAKRSKGQPG